MRELGITYTSAELRRLADRANADRRPPASYSHHVAPFMPNLSIDLPKDWPVASPDLASMADLALGEFDVD